MNLPGDYDFRFNRIDFLLLIRLWTTVINGFEALLLFNSFCNRIVGKNTRANGGRKK